MLQLTPSSDCKFFVFAIRSDPILNNALLLLPIYSLHTSLSYPQQQNEADVRDPVSRPLTIPVDEVKLDSKTHKIWTLLNRCMNGAPEWRTVPVQVNIPLQKTQPENGRIWTMNRALTKHQHACTDLRSKFEVK